MINPLKVLKWRICGCYNPDGPVTKNGSDRARNRAKYEAWKYNTIGPGRITCDKDFTYGIIDNGVLSQEPLYLHDPWLIAAMASIIAEMEDHKSIASREPRVISRDQQFALEKIIGEEDRAIDRAANHYQFTYDLLRSMLDKLKQYNNPA